MIVIEGEAYEFIKKYLFFPGAEIIPITAFSKPVGLQKIEVKYVIRVPEAPSRVLNMLSKGKVASFISTIVTQAINNRENWKQSNEGAYETEDMNVALWLAEMVRRVHGGCWIIVSNGKYYVWSKGYYHYVGA